MALRAIDKAGRDPHLSAWVGAVIVRGGAVIETGANRREMTAYARRIWKRHRTFCNTTHAEIDAILRARKRIDLRGCKVYVLRVLRSGEIANARPCEMCMAALGRHGITDVCYTVNATESATERVPPPERLRTTRLRRSQLRASPSK